MPVYGDQVEALLNELCVELGFCLPDPKRRVIAAQNQWEARSFAAAVLRAEGLEPEYERKWVARIADRFQKRFGRTLILKSEFTS